MNLRPFSKPASLVTPWVITADSAELLDQCAPSMSVQLDSARLIIPRQYLFYTNIPLANLPKSLRANLIHQRVQQASPFANVGSWVVQSDDSAQVWFWDAERIANRRGENPQLPQTLLPEPLLRQPQTDGFYLQTCLFGWDMQYWLSGELRHTRWTPSKPDARVQTDFVRQCGKTIQGVDWVELAPDLLSRPWSEKPFWTRETLTQEKIASKLIAAVLIAWACLELGLGFGTEIKSSWLAAQVAEKNEAMMDLVSQRDGALRQQEFNQAVSELVSTPSPLFLSAQVNQCLAKFDFALLDWQYQRGQLIVVLQKEGLDTRALIESCTSNPAFTDVRVEPGITPDQTRVLFSLPGAVSEEQNDAG
ncbi:hypothetical protein [Cellvibrio sp. KY-GH-1]|uniref:hypothetical protein n=1 Tax=Cellvibrio sp. KY-GH-1 TaxID=2303332 RepID=UPI001246C563|nr:hypothetical protein [Cellvibrio sp. KY-GH-1]